MDTQPWRPGNVTRGFAGVRCGTAMSMHDINIGRGGVPELIYFPLKLLELGLDS